MTSGEKGTANGMGCRERHQKRSGSSEETPPLVAPTFYPHNSQQTPSKRNGKTKDCPMPTKGEKPMQKGVGMTEVGIKRQLASDNHL